MKKEKEVKEEVIEKTEQSEKVENKKLSTKENLWQTLKFVLFSISAGVIQIVAFTILNEWVIRDVGMEYGWSYFIALVLSVLWNFTFNRKFTFKSANNVPIAMLEVFAYYVVFTPCSIFWGEALTKVGWNEYLVLAFTMIINFVTEFLFQRFVVFRKSINTNDLAKKEKKKGKKEEAAAKEKDKSENAPKAEKIEVVDNSSKNQEKAEKTAKNREKSNKND